MLESYRNRIPAPIAELDSEDENFWLWVLTENIPVTQTTTSGRANHLLHSGVAAAVAGEIPTNYFKAQGFRQTLELFVGRKFLPKGKL